MHSKLLIFKILFFFQCLAVSLAQPKISYIIPDIGSKGLGVYVEIIGPHNYFGNFGNDTLYLNNNGKVRIVFDRLEDTNKIIVGPLAVFWQGRMIATYFFVNPDINEPNSEDWTLLNSEFRIPFRVAVDGNLSNPDTFYIVKPYSFGNLVQANQVFGSGQLGRRSRSGAMIVDNLNLENLEYKAFLNNTLSFPTRNRTYLPFILLCTGNITGRGTSSRINVSGGDIRIQNAGPGGGGGGGKFCDHLTGNPGEEGGNGFTSGGRGGVNNLTGGGAYKSLGLGTGDSGKSLNEIPPPEIPYGWEASGGGTGHPFGRCGIGSGDQSNWNRSGGYGGGTGSINNRTGGAGGYASEGQSDPSNYINGGKIHGNRMIVPIAGGSGGASGNPSGFNVCAGSGGGGGGAIRIFARNIENLSVLANGASGGQSSYGAGGGGSGGSISICAKLVAQNLSLSANGGTGGGRGYFRLDAPSIANVSFSHTNPSAFVGVSTDTVSVVKRNFTINGGKNPNSDSVLVFVKSQKGDWVLDTIVSGFIGSNNWNVKLSLPDTSRVFYLCAIQDFNYYFVDTFKYQPRYLFSQSATNILRRQLQGICSGTDKLKKFILDCPGNVYLDSGYIKNIGDGELRVFFSRSRFKKNLGFELVSPRSDVVLQPNDSIKFLVKYTLNGSGLEQTLIDTLLIEHSDDDWSNNPWKVEIRLEVYPYKFDVYSFDRLNILDTLRLGVICGEERIDTICLVWNRSSFSLRFGYSISGNRLTFKSSQEIVGSGFNDTLNISILPGKNFGEFLDSIVVFPLDCPALRKVLYIKYFRINVSTAFKYKNKIVDTINVGLICVGKTYKVNFAILNSGNYPIKIINVDNTGASAINYDFQIGRQIFASDSIVNSLEINPNADGKIFIRLIYAFDICNHFDTLFVVAEAISSNTVLIHGGYFGFVSVGETDTAVVVIINRGTGTSYFDKEPTSNSVFNFIGSEPEIPTYLRPGDTLKLYYTFSPSSVGEFNKIVELFSNSEIGCPDSVRFLLKGYGTNATIFANVDSVFLGTFLHCKSKDTIIYITNKGTSDLIVQRVYIRQNYNPEHFILSNSLSKNVIPPNSVDSCAVKFVGVKGAAPGLKTAELIIESNDKNNPRISIKLSAIQENLNVDLLPDTLDFGVCQIGDFKRRTLLLVNYGTVSDPQRIRDIEGNKNVFEPNPSSAVLFPKDSVRVVFTFRPDREGEFFDSMRIVYYSPCPDTQWVYLKGWGTAGSYSVPNRIDFGNIPICSSDTIRFSVENLGTIRFRIDSSIIIGNDARFFKVQTTFPVLVDSVRELVLIFSGNDGPRRYSATLRLFIFINNSTRFADITLTANRVRFVNFVVSEINFGQVPINSTNILPFVIENTGPASLIRNVLQFNNPLVFSTDLIGNLSLSANSNLTQNVTFKPNREGWFYDTLKVAIQYPDCIDTILLPLRGYGLPPVSAEVRVGEVLFNPKSLVGYLPVYARLSEFTQPISSLHLECKIQYYWSIYHIQNIVKGEILDDRIVNPNRIITFRCLIDTLKGEEIVVGQFLGVPLLSDTDFSKVSLLECNWSRPAYFKETKLLDGSIRIEICTEGGKRLLKQPNQLVVNFINSNNPYKIEIETTTKGKHLLQVLTLFGNAVIEKEFVNDDNETKSFSFEFDLSHFPAGVYFLRVTNLSSNKVYKFIH
ncbi:MAG: choice-of-anchor D domain-containing protein [Ignavibacteria bacterium]|nr:choice-of-anchor D domain-containing protein [Ignavibacteria bacterium]